MKHEFPKWFFHKDQMPDGKVVHSQDDFEKLGKGWVETPALFDVAKTETCETEEKEKLEAIKEIVDATPEKPTKKGRAK